jgi:hypothetical protein
MKLKIVCIAVDAEHLYWTYFYFVGTCLKAMSVDWLLWVTMAVYVSLRFALRKENDFKYLDLGDTDISVIGGKSQQPCNLRPKAAPSFVSPKQ